MRIGILGAGTWGTALAALLTKNGQDVALWSALPEEIAQIRRDAAHKNLPGVPLPSWIRYTDSIEEAVKDTQLIIFVTPSAYLRETAERAAGLIEDGATLITASKGLESGSLLTMTEILEDVTSRRRPEAHFDFVALSGPTHAEEVASGLPTSIVAACKNEEVSRRIAAVFANSCMRVYTNTDVRGVEISGALKNIIALAAGMSNGMGFGDNAKAMLITRGAQEIMRMGLALGCERATFTGLAGIGDLIVTCTSVHSRNNRCGELIGRGLSYEDASSQIGMVVEGYHALEAAIEMSHKYDVDMPITEAVYDVIKHGRSTYDAMRELMNRDIKSELT